MKLIPIFRAGRHLATNGQTYDFTDAIVAASAAAYDPAKHEAPLVVGHPKTDDPAYGWVESLSYRERGLDAIPKQVEPQFAELYATGRFKKVSASFYPPDHPQNPVPGVYYLRHVGFLGAAPPAVKGLKAASFADEQGVIEFADWADTQNASLWRRLREWIISKHTIEEADKVVPDYAVAALEDAARADAAGSGSPMMSYSEQTAEEKQMALTQQQLDQQAAELKKQQDAQAAKDVAFAEREAKIKTAEDAQRAEAAKRHRAAIAEFVEALVKEGKVLPALKEGLIAFMAGTDQAGVVEFGEGDKHEKKPALEWLKSYLAAQPKIVEFKETAKTGVEVDLDNPKEIAKRAVEFQETERKAGREISVTAAVQHVTKGAN